MRYIAKVGFVVIIELIIIALILTIGYARPTLPRILYYNLSDIDDYEIFQNRILTPSPKPFSFNRDNGTTNVPTSVSLGNDKVLPLENFLSRTETLAFLIIRDDEIRYERYLNGHSVASISYSFSMAKSILSILVGIAIEEGYLNDVTQPVTDFIPELGKSGFDELTLEHLLQMTSGLNYSESNLNPLSLHAHLYHSMNLEHEILRFTLAGRPGETFEYKSGDTMILSLALERAIQPRNLTDYLQQKLWNPLGMEFRALWSVDSLPDGLEKAWCCIAAAARDFAKLGRLYLNEGKWQGQQIVPRDWVQRSTRKDIAKGSVQNYQYGWWIMSDEYGDYRAEGLRGQFIYINPLKRMVIVRLGKGRGGIAWSEWKEVLTFIAEHTLVHR